MKHIKNFTQLNEGIEIIKYKIINSRNSIPFYAFGEEEPEPSDITYKVCILYIENFDNMSDIDIILDNISDKEIQFIYWDKPKFKHGQIYISNKYILDKIKEKFSNIKKGFNSSYPNRIYIALLDNITINPEDGY